MKNVKASVIVVLSLIFLTFVTSLVFVLVSGNGKRYTFVFPSADSDTCIIEHRFLPSKPLDPVSFYVDELLLGAVTERTRLIFPKGTRVLSCFQRGDTLYLNLSKEFLSPEKGTVSMKYGTELLESNIKSNFSSIKKIELFVDSKRAWEQ